MNGKKNTCCISLIFVLWMILSVASTSLCQATNDTQTKWSCSNAELRVYFLPLNSESIFPINEKMIKYMGGKMTLSSSNDIATLINLVRGSNLLMTHHNRYNSHSPEFNPNNVRLRIEASGGERLIFVDTNGVVNDMGKQGELTPNAKQRLGNFIECLASKVKQNEHDLPNPHQPA